MPGGELGKLDWIFGSHALERGLKADVFRGFETKETFDDERFSEQIEEYFNYVEVEMVARIRIKEDWHMYFEYSKYDDSKQADYSILDAVG